MKGHHTEETKQKIRETRLKAIERKGLRKIKKKEPLEPKLEVLLGAEQELEIKQIEERLLELDKEYLKHYKIDERYRETHQSQFFVPLPYQQQVIDYIHQGKTIVVFQGGNRIGKTLTGANIMSSLVEGRELWENGKPSIFKLPVRIRILCEDWRKGADDIIIPALKKWLVTGNYTTKKNLQGSEYLWTFNNGSIIEIITNKEDTRSQEGWAGHFLWIDEVCPEDKFITNTRGLIDVGGVTLFTMTAIGEPWIYDKIFLNPSPTIGCVMEIPMRANSYLSETAIRNFEATSCTDELERSIRIEGKWLKKTGLVFKNFKRDIHIKKASSMSISPDWRIIPVIDFHTRENTAISFLTASPQDVVFVIDEVWAELDAEEIADCIIKTVERNKWRCDLALIDPLAKSDGINDSFAKIEKKLNSYNIKLEEASKDKVNGIKNVQRWVMGQNEVPSFFIFDNCERHIQEFLRYSYDDNGDFEKGNDHFIENCRRLTFCDWKWRPLQSFKNLKKVNLKYI